MTDFLEGLPARAAALHRVLVYPEGEDPRVVEAAAELAERGIARPVLLGSLDTVATRLGGYGSRVRDVVRVLDPLEPERVADFIGRCRMLGWGKNADGGTLAARAADPLVQAALMIRDGQADGAVAGCVRSTADVLRTSLRCLGTAPGISTISSAFYMHLAAGTVAGEPSEPGNVLTFTDAGVVPDPTSEQLAEIALAAVRARRLVVGDEPRVAFLSYSTHGSAGGASVEKVRAALERFRTLDPSTPADGEIQADAALVDAVRRRKAPGSPLVENANVLVFPNLDAGNIAYKLVQRLAGATALGPILQGLGGAVNDLSRGADTKDIVLVSCITALMAG